MTKYQAKPGAMVMGVSVIGSVEGLGIYKEVGYRLLRECGIQDVSPDEWYPVQEFSQFFDLLSTRIGNVTLLVMGRTVANQTPMIPGIDTIEQCMGSFDQGFHMFFRGVGVDEGWKCQVTGPNSAKLTFRGVFPSSYVRGLAEGFCKRLQKSAEVQIDEAQTTADGTTGLLVSW